MLRYEDILNISGNFTEEFCNSINSSKEYNQAAKGWGIGFEGAILWVFEASGVFEDDIKIYLDLKDGKCLQIRLISPNEELKKNPILVLRAPLKVWKEMRTKRSAPTQFIISGKVKIEGNMRIIMRYSKAATELGKIAAKQTFLRRLFSEYDLN